MKLVMVCSWPPFPLHSGARLRSYETLCFLARSHEIRLLTFVAGPREREASRLLQGVCEVECFAYASAPGDPALPPNLHPFQSQALGQRLAELGEQGVQATLFDQLFVSQHWPSAAGIPVLLEHNIESEILRRSASFADPRLRLRLTAQALGLRHYEEQVWPRFPLRTCTTTEDAELMRQRCSLGSVVVVPNGVNLQRYQPLAEKEGVGRLLFVGALDYWPNQDAMEFFCAQIWPRLRSAHPDMLLRVIGRNPSAELVKMLGDQSGLELFPNAGDLAPLVEGSRISIVPLRVGSGSRLKILEAAAWGLPVVSTSMGCQGLDFQPGVHLSQADEPEEFAAQVGRLWVAAEERRRLGQAARRLVERCYGWEQVLGPLQEALTCL